MSLEAARQLWGADQHGEARDPLAELALQAPEDALVQYEAACVHDALGLPLPAELRRSACTWPGSPD